MKNIIIGTASFVIALLLIMTVYTLQGRETRSEEIYDGLSNAMSAAGEQIIKEEGYESDEALEAAFIENLMQQLDSSSHVGVTVLKADHEKGILCAEVTETYKHPNGKEGKVSCKRTYIIEQKGQGGEKKSYPVGFYLEKTMKEEDLYKTSVLPEGAVIHEPKPPEKKGYIFVEWKDAMTNETALFKEENGIHEERQYYATWKEETK